MISKVETLLSALDSARQVMILPHNNPDPDAIASAVALSHLMEQQRGVASQIAYNGVIGRAENRALVRYLGNPLRRLTADDLREPAPIALVDTQPSSGNSAVNSDMTVSIVIDHHPCCDTPIKATFADIRPKFGATSTILTEYFQEAGLQPSPALATALFYGIKTDTLGLVRGTSAADIAAYLYLQAYIDVGALIAIENAPVPAAYFAHLDASVQAARVYDDVIVAYIGAIHYPDLVGEMADLLMRLEHMQWSICMGVYNDVLILSTRTRQRRGGAGKLVRTIVGLDGTAGGHGAMAGGQIPLHGRNPDQIAHEMTQRILNFLGIPPETQGRPLLWNT